MDREELIKIIVARAREYHAIIPVVCRKMIADDILDREQGLTEENEQYKISIELMQPMIAKLEKENKELQQNINVIEKEVSEVYCYITNGKLSKPTYLASVMIAEIDEMVSRDIEENSKEIEKEKAEIDESFKNLYVEFEEKDNELIKLQQSFTESKMPEKREMIEHICIGKHGCRACHIAGSNMALGKCRLVEQRLRGEIASEKSMREFYQDKYWKLKNLLNGDRLRIAVGKVVLENNRNVTVEQVIKAIQGEE